MTRWLLLLCLLFCVMAQADYRPVSSVTLPMMMPVNQHNNWHGRQLIVGVLEENNAPWAMRVGNDLYGIDADYLAALSQLTGVQFAVKAFPDEARLLAALKNGDLDFLLGVAHPALPPGFLLSDSWYSSPLRIYRNRENRRAVMFNSRDAQLAVSRQTLSLLPPALMTRHRWREYGSDLQALYTLLNQQNDYVVADETSASFLLSQLQQGQIYQLASGIETGQLTLRAVAQNRELLDWLNQSLRQLPVELVNTIQGRWISPLPRYQDTQTLALTTMERQWLSTHPVVRYAAESNNSPWSYRDASGEAHGYGIDLLNAIGQSTGLRFEPRWVSNPQQAGVLLQQQQVELQLMQPLNGEMMQSATLPVWRALWGIYSTGRTPLMRWDDLRGKRIGVMQNDLAQRLLPAGIQSQPFSERGSLYDALANGQIDALVDNVLSARWLVASRYADRIHLAFAASDIAWPIAMGVSPAQPLLREILDKGLQQIPPETQRQMRDKWTMPPQPGSERVMRSLPVMVLTAAIAAIVVLLILLIRRYLQQRQERLQREQAERANQMKSQFLATVSHELRTPMQAILGLLELEQQQRDSANLTLLHSSARSLLTLLNDLQDHARIESNSFSLAPRPLELPHWLAQLQRFYHPLMRDDGPRLVVEALTPLPDRVLIDADRLQQVTNNLVANALKFTRAGEIRLTLAVTQQIVLTISDSGSGIPPDEQQKLFDPWYQAPSGKAVSVQGSGLGLFICREIVQRMGGDIVLHSTPGVGTRVTVTLPLQPVDDASPQAVDVPDWPRYPSLRAAIVDDHPANLLVMQQQLARFAIHADCFAEGRALLRADAVQPYDLLLIDQMMPRPDGALLLRILRRRDRKRKRYVLRVLCSADAQLLHPGSVMANEVLLIKPLALQDIARVLAQGFSDPLARLEENINRLAQHNPKYVARLSATLCQTLHSDSEAIGQAHLARNWSGLASAAHRMKSSWLLLGIEQGAMLSQQLVEKAQQHQDAPEERKLLILLTNRLLEKLEDYGPHTQSHGK